ncbi:hypothetical protein MTP03_26160 [Tsukamurella sp. PLM1]|nr:hypothetical protein MTP03_26160 [Tsukamurella sp. PLM1]
MPSAIMGRSHRARSCSAGDERTVGVGPRVPAGVDEQHEGEQAGGFRVVGHVATQQARQADRLGREIGTHQPSARRRRVALVESEVENRADRRGTDLQVVGGGEFEPGSGPAELLFGPADPRRHGLLRDTVRVGDLRGAQASHGAQREGDP